MKKISVKVSDLPLELEVTSADGELKQYQIRPAGRKFGAFLCQTDEQREKR